MFNHKSTSTLAIVLLTLLLAGQDPSAAHSRQSSSNEHQELSEGFAQFSNHVRAYVNLRKSAASGVPGNKPTDLPEVINARQLALARKIREARPNAKQGDIFTGEATKAFQTVIQAQFNGPDGYKARTTIRQGDPLPPMQLKVNETYPPKLPFTTVPPALLLKLPKLPEVVGYRIVGRDFVLLDLEANLVVDVIPEAIPKV